MLWFFCVAYLVSFTLSAPVDLMDPQCPTCWQTCSTVMKDYVSRNLVSLNSMCPDVEARLLAARNSKTVLLDDDIASLFNLKKRTSLISHDFARIYDAEHCVNSECEEILHNGFVTMYYDADRRLCLTRIRLPDCITGYQYFQRDVYTIESNTSRHGFEMNYYNGVQMYSSLMGSCSVYISRKKPYVMSFVNDEEAYTIGVKYRIDQDVNFISLSPRDTKVVTLPFKPKMTLDVRCGEEVRNTVIEISSKEVCKSNYGENLTDSVLSYIYCVLLPSLSYTIYAFITCVLIATLLYFCPILIQLCFYPFYLCLDYVQMKLPKRLFCPVCGGWSLLSRFHDHSVCICGVKLLGEEGVSHLYRCSFYRQNRDVRMRKWLNSNVGLRSLLIFACIVLLIELAPVVRGAGLCVENCLTGHSTCPPTSELHPVLCPGGEVFLEAPGCRVCVMTADSLNVPKVHITSNTSAPDRIKNANLTQTSPLDFMTLYITAIAMFILFISPILCTPIYVVSMMLILLAELIVLLLLSLFCSFHLLILFTALFSSSYIITSLLVSGFCSSVQIDLLHRASAELSNPIFAIRLLTKRSVDLISADYYTGLFRSRSHYFLAINERTPLDKVVEYYVRNDVRQYILSSYILEHHKLASAFKDLFKNRFERRYLRRRLAISEDQIKLFLRDEDIYALLLSSSDYTKSKESYHAIEAFKPTATHSLSDIEEESPYNVEGVITNMEIVPSSETSSDPGSGRKDLSQLDSAHQNVIRSPGTSRSIKKTDDGIERLALIDAMNRPTLASMSNNLKFENTILNPKFREKLGEIYYSSDDFKLWSIPYFLPAIAHTPYLSDPNFIHNVKQLHEFDEDGCPTRNMAVYGHYNDSEESDSSEIPLNAVLSTKLISNTSYFSWTFSVPFLIYDKVFAPLGLLRRLSSLNPKSWLISCKFYDTDAPLSSVGDGVNYFNLSASASLTDAGYTKDHSLKGRLRRLFGCNLLKYSFKSSTDNWKDNGYLPCYPPSRPSMSIVSVLPLLLCIRLMACLLLLPYVIRAVNAGELYDALEKMYSDHIIELKNKGFTTSQVDFTSCTKLGSVISRDDDYHAIQIALRPGSCVRYDVAGSRIEMGIYVRDVGLMATRDFTYRTCELTSHRAYTYAGCPGSSNEKCLKAITDKYPGLKNEPYQIVNRHTNVMGCVVGNSVLCAYCKQEVASGNCYDVYRAASLEPYVDICVNLISETLCSVLTGLTALESKALKVIFDPALRRNELLFAVDSMETVYTGEIASPQSDEMKFGQPQYRANGETLHYIKSPHSALNFGWLWYSPTWEGGCMYSGWHLRHTLQKRPDIRVIADRVLMGIDTLGTTVVSVKVPEGFKEVIAEKFQANMVIQSCAGCYRCGMYTVCKLSTSSDRTTFAKLACSGNTEAVIKIKLGSSVTEFKTISQTKTTLLSCFLKTMSGETVANASLSYEAAEDVRDIMVAKETMTAANINTAECSDVLCSITNAVKSVNPFNIIKTIFAVVGVIIGIIVLSFIVRFILKVVKEVRSTATFIGDAIDPSGLKASKKEKAKQVFKTMGDVLKHDLSNINKTVKFDMGRKRDTVSQEDVSDRDDSVTRASKSGSHHISRRDDSVRRRISKALKGFRRSPSYGTLPR